MSVVRVPPRVLTDWTWYHWICIAVMKIRLINMLVICHSSAVSETQLWIRCLMLQRYSSVLWYRTMFKMQMTLSPHSAPTDQLNWPQLNFSWAVGDHDMAIQPFNCLPTCSPSCPPTRSPKGGHEGWDISIDTHIQVV